MTCDCNTNNPNCCDKIDSLLESIQNGLGQVDYDKINEYIDKQIAGLTTAIESGEVAVEIDYDTVAEKVKEALDNDELTVNAGDVAYKDGTVEEKLDELSKIAFNGTISSLRTFEKGEVVYNQRVSWNFTKPLKALSIGLYVNDMNTETIELDPTVGYYEIPVLQDTTNIVVKGTSVDDEDVTLTTDANFKLKYYVGCSGDKGLQNKEVLALTSYFTDKKQTEYSFIFNPNGKQYLWWIFPVDLHTDYDFFNNGMMDSNYEWFTKNVTNQHGYTYSYIFIRSGNPHTAANIYSEVKAHEHK